MVVKNRRFISGGRTRPEPAFAGLCPNFPKSAQIIAHPPRFVKVFIRLGQIKLFSAKLKKRLDKLVSALYNGRGLRSISHRYCTGRRLFKRLDRLVQIGHTFLCKLVENALTFHSGAAAPTAICQAVDRRGVSRMCRRPKAPRIARACACPT